MNAVDRIGCLPLKYRRSAHGALVNAVEDRLIDRARPLSGNSITEASTLDYC